MAAAVCAAASRILAISALIDFNSIQPEGRIVLHEFLVENLLTNLLKPSKGIRRLLGAEFLLDKAALLDHFRA